MKHCPECDFKTDNKDYNFCPKCGDRKGKGLVKLIDDTLEATADPESSSGIKIGMGAVVTGGIEQHFHTTPLTEAERIKKNKESFRSECDNKCHNGFISAEDLRELELYRDKIGLERHFAESILEKAKKDSIKKIVELPQNAKDILDKANDAIINNDLERVSSAFKDLKIWHEKNDNDVLNQMYFQLKSIIEPVKYIDEIETITDYWGVFWAYVAYMKVAKSKAEDILTELPKWDAHYAVQNQPLLRAVGYLMEEHFEDAKRAFRSVTVGYSPDLQPIYETLDSLIGKEWLSLSDDVPTRLKFYSDSLFKNAYESLKKQAADSQAKRLEEEEIQRQQEAADRHKLGKVITAYKSNGGEINDACEAAGVITEQFYQMLLKYPDFAQKFEDAKLGVKLAKEQAILEAKLAAEREREIAENKALFKRKFEDNKCDLQKTCNEIGIDSSVYRAWLNSDQAFAEGIKYIEGVIEKEREAEKERIKRELRKKRWEKFKKLLVKKLLPWLLIAILSIVCVFGILKLKDNCRFNKDKVQTEKEYELAIANFNDAFSHVDTSKEGLDALYNAAISLKQILKLENTPFIDGRNDSETLKRQFDDRVEELLENYKNKTSLTPEEGGNEITWKDGKNGQKRVKEIINTLQK